MNKNIQKMESKKEYEAPQMEVLDCKVQGNVLSCSEAEVDCPGIVEIDNG